MAPLVFVTAINLLENTSKRDSNTSLYQYDPNFVSNVTALVIFSVTFIAQVGLASYFKQRWFGIMFCLGVACE